MGGNVTRYDMSVNKISQALLRMYTVFTKNSQTLRAPDKHKEQFGRPRTSHNDLPVIG